MAKYLLLFISGLCLSFLSQAQITSCPSKVKVRILITPDNFPAQTYWDLVSANGDTLKKGLANSDSVCVDSSVCVRFTIHDKGNNGLCCTNGVGSYQVFYGEILVRSNYKFKSSESVSMGCVKCQPEQDEEQVRIYINPDRFPDEISWDLLSESGDTLGKGK
jgi:hypothetical protein